MALNRPAGSSSFMNIKHPQTARCPSAVLDDDCSELYQDLSVTDLLPTSSLCPLLWGWGAQ